MIIRSAFAGLVLLAASACTAMPGPSEPPGVSGPVMTEPTIVDRTGDAEPSCAAEAYQVLVGQRVGEIDRASLPVPNRVYGRGDMITMDFRMDRMNIVVGNDGLVQEVKCG
jgi:hypothetical protein